MYQRILAAVAGRIMEAATTWPADVLVIGTHERRGLEHLLLGSIAECVPRLTPMPVPLVRGH